MISHETMAAPGVSLSQSERDEIENRAVQEAWLSLAGTLPTSIQQGISRGELFYSALDLAEHVIGPKQLAGWRVAFTTSGGPYTAALRLQDEELKIQSELEVTHPFSLTLAIIAVVRKWADNSADRKRRG